MGIFLSLFIFTFGLIIGSFLNCVIYRLETKKNFLKGRSFCPRCKHVLNWQDLAPIFSFLILIGKCRYCKKKISWQYPAVELATGLLFLLIFSALGGIPSLRDNFQTIASFLYLLIISALLIVIFVFDLKNYIIPDKVLFPAIGLVFLFRIFNFSSLPNFLLSAFFASLFFFAIFFFSKGLWMGFGDVKLAFFMGLFLGFPNILAALFLSFLFGAIIGLSLIFLRKKSLKSELPFGPFLILGTFIALFWGNSLINWYLSLL